MKQMNETQKIKVKESIDVIRKAIELIDYNLYEINKGSRNKIFDDKDTQLKEVAEDKLRELLKRLSDKR